MINPTLVFTLLCITLIPNMVHCNTCGEDTCVKACFGNKVDKPCDFSCGNTKTCTQVCSTAVPLCGTLNCGGEKCRQFCLNCPEKTKLTCSSEVCEQLCSGKNCNMECTEDVKTCKQICNEGSTCTLACNNDKTNCQPTCQNATCTGVKSPPKKTAECDEDKCAKNCSGYCKKTTLSCANVTKCDMSCEDGCTMFCDHTVKDCSLECRGDVPCKATCRAQSCRILGKMCSAAPFHQFSQILYTCILGSLVLTWF